MCLGKRVELETGFEQPDESVLNTLVDPTLAFFALRAIIASLAEHGALLTRGGQLHPSTRSRALWSNKHVLALVPSYMLYAFPARLKRTCSPVSKRSAQQPCFLKMTLLPSSCTPPRQERLRTSVVHSLQPNLALPSILSLDPDVLRIRPSWGAWHDLCCSLLGMARNPGAPHGRTPTRPLRRAQGQQIHRAPLPYEILAQLFRPAHSTLSAFLASFMRRLQSGSTGRRGLLLEPPRSCDLQLRGTPALSSPSAAVRARRSLHHHSRNFPDRGQVPRRRCL